MQELFDIPYWDELFLPTVPLLETLLRGTIIYLALFALLRFILKRESGTLGITDLLVLVLITEASQNSIAGEFKSITDGIFLVAVIVFWSHALNWLGFKFPFLQKIIKPNKLPLVKNGKIIKRNMAEELITREELETEMRTNGVDDISKVKVAYMEGNGHISFICKEERKTSPPPKSVVR
ncbi:MAG TPA: YetF domain-containing protein [Cytophagales bacterium]|nr:YetF domain-containing protein [Cytophagales bacterium]